MNKKYWFAGVASDANGHGETVAVHGYTFDEASAKFFKKYGELAKDPKAFVDMMTPFYFDEWIEEDGDKDFIPLRTVDTDDSFVRLRKYFIEQ